MNESEAIKGCISGNSDAFETLYNMHKQKIYSLCLRMVRNPEEAEDLTQESFMQLFRKINTFRGDSEFSTWLHRLTVNIVLMRIRKKRPKQVSIDQEPENDESFSKKEFGSDDIQLIGTVDRLTLEKAISTLPEGYRTIFILHDVEGYEHHEIAEIVGCSIGNSKSQLFKARLRLRLHLKNKKKLNK